MESRTQFAFVTTTEDILKELTLSKENKNVVGVYAEPFSESMYLACVDNIIDVDIVNDKIVILKKFDLQGRFIETHQIYFSQILRIRPFKTFFKEDLLMVPFSHSEVHLEAEPVKIKQQEQIVTLPELRVILIKNIESGNRVKIKTDPNNHPLDYCYIRGFSDSKFENIVVSRGLEDTDKEVIPIRKIESLEFDHFLYFKGLTSKTFRCCSK